MTNVESTNESHCYSCHPPKILLATFCEIPMFNEMMITILFQIKLCIVVNLDIIEKQKVEENLDVCSILSPYAASSTSASLLILSLRLFA